MAKAGGRGWGGGGDYSREAINRGNTVYIFLNSLAILSGECRTCCAVRNSLVIKCQVESKVDWTNSIIFFFMSI